MILLRQDQLDHAAASLAAGDALLQPALDALLADADEALALRPPTVMDKPDVPPSGDKHDYMSLGTYWWPDPEKPDGLPYIRRDGYGNPAGHVLDRNRLHAMADAALTLALAWRFTGKDRYADKGRELLHVWFVEPDTRMNPHLNYGQHIPGRCEGRCFGIVDTLALINAVDAAAMLPGVDPGVRSWTGDYVTWLTTSPLGQEEEQTRNNHAVAWDKQVVAFALFAGRTELARDVLAAIPARRYATQIEPNGSMPHELARTKSWSYTVVNLRHFCDLADLARHVDPAPDLYHATSDGRCMRPAIDFWLAEGGMGDWPREQVGGINRALAASVLRRAALAYDEPAYEKHLQSIPDIDRDRVQLLHPKR